MESNPLIKKKCSGFGTHLFNVRYSLLAALCTAFIMTVVYFCYKLFPFGNITILRMDLYHQYGPLFAELYSRITHFDSLLYSWKSGGGGAFLGNFYNYLSSPFAIIMLILGHNNMPEAIAAMILLKAATASFTFSYFISKKYDQRSPLVSAFGVLYACCGYFIAYYWNVMWLDSFYLFPLVILGIEQLVSKRKMKLFVITLALTFFTNYYMAYMVCLFSVLYFIYYYFCSFSFLDTYCGKLEQRKGGVKNFFKWLYNNLRNSKFVDCGARFAFGAVGAALLSAFSLLPVYYVLQNCSATSGTFPDAFKTYFSVFDFLANHLAYLDPTIRSSGTDVLPNVYCGMLTVIMIPLYLFSNRITGKEKVLSVGFLGFMFASCYTNYLNYIWHGFHFPNDLPYRFSYMYSFLLLILAFRALNFISEYSKRQIIGVGVATIFFIIFVQKLGSKNVTGTGAWISIAFVIIYCIALGILKSDKYPRVAAAVLLLCSVCAEYTVANTNNYSMDQPKDSYVGDYKDFEKTKTKLDALHGNDSYRMELTNLRARMDPCWYYYNGVSTFSSMAYEKASNLQYQLGMFGNYINSYTYHRQTPIYNAFFSLNYIVDNDTTNTAPFSTEYYKKLFKQDKFTAYENEYNLPIAFCVNNSIMNWNTNSSDPFEVQSDLFRNATGLKGVYDNFDITNVVTQNVDSDYASYTGTGCYPFNVQSEGTDSSMSFDVSVTKTEDTFIYFKSGANNVTRVTITLADGTIIAVPIDTKPYILDLGVVKAGSTVSVYAPITDGSSGYLYLYAVGLNDQVFKEGYSALKKDSMNVTKYAEREIDGTVNASKDGILYTSINYDTGWSVYVDGKKAPSKDIVTVGGALLGLKVTAGKHTLSFKYTPPGLWMGLALSAMTLLVLIVLSLMIKNGMFRFDPPLYEEKAEEKPSGNDLPQFYDDETIVKKKIGPPPFNPADGGSDTPPDTI